MPKCFDKIYTNYIRLISFNLSSESENKGRSCDVDDSPVENANFLIPRFALNVQCAGTISEQFFRVFSY